MYRVIKAFKDKETTHVYHKGDNFPFRGQVTKDRADELLTDKNNENEPLIETFDVVIEEDYTEPVETDEQTAYPKHTGGGWYELSNGEKVQGKEEAEEAENEFKSGE